MLKSKNFGFNLPESTDLVKNMRLDYNPNFEKIDELLKNNTESSKSGISVYIASNLPDIPDRKKKTFYFRVTNINDLIDDSYDTDEPEFNENILMSNSGDMILSNDNYVILTNS